MYEYIQCHHFIRARTDVGGARAAPRQLADTFLLIRLAQLRDYIDQGQ